MIRKRNAHGGFVGISGGDDEVRHQPGFNKGARVEVPRCGVWYSTGTNHLNLSTTECKIDRGNQKPRAPVRDDALTGRIRVVKDANLSAVLYVLGTGDWLILWLLS